MLRVVTHPDDPPAVLDETAIAPRLKPPTTDEARVLELIEDATRAAEEIAARRLWFRTYEELQVLEVWGRRLYLEARPIASVTSVAFGDDDPLTEGTDADQFTIYQEAGYLYRQDGWDTGLDGWKCTYTGGYWLPSMGAAPDAGEATIEAQGPHLRRAVSEIVSATWSRFSRDPTVRARRIGGDAPIAHEFGNLLVPETAKSTLEGLAHLVP